MNEAERGPDGPAPFSLGQVSYPRVAQAQIVSAYRTFHPMRKRGF